MFIFLILQLRLAVSRVYILIDIFIRYIRSIRYRDFHPRFFFGLNI